MVHEKNTAALSHVTARIATVISRNVIQVASAVVTALFFPTAKDTDAEDVQGPDPERCPPPLTLGSWVMTSTQALLKYVAAAFFRDQKKNYTRNYWT